MTRKEDTNKDFSALLKFRERNRDLIPHISGSVMICRVKVVFKAPERQIRVEAETKLRLHVGGFEEGQIDLDEVGALSDATLHLQYKPEFQDYRVRGDSLVVRGNGSRKVGDYSVKITPY